jgi:hypothetical protein
MPSTISSTYRGSITIAELRNYVSGLSIGRCSAIQSRLNSAGNSGYPYAVGLKAFGVAPS